MDRLFLDTNVLFLLPISRTPVFSGLWTLKDVVLCSSRYAVAEANLNLEHDSQRKRLAELAEKLQLFEAPARDLPRGISLPEKDVPILVWPPLRHERRIC